MKIMQKVSQWLSGLSNASKIRANTAQVFSVKNQLRMVNTILFLTGLGLLGYALNIESDAAPAGLTFALSFTWFFGLRLAIANSRESKERYVKKTVQILGNLGKFVFWSAVICAIVVYVGVVLCTMIEIGYFDDVVKVYPALKSLSSSITLQMNKMLEKLLSFIG